ncbi:DUF6660 family protein [Flavisolibacter tropicus]|uniref:DUF6660 family protein n=1 Tax=Flavisolibacter tropicus TaxID=1492898 RepID=UPI0026D08B58
MATVFTLDCNLSVCNFAALKRVLAFILSLIILSQSFLACRDTAMHKDDGVAKYELLTASDHQNSAADACPPFCQCNCCAGFTINHTIEACTEPTIEHTSIIYGDLTEPLLSLSRPIWEPPQLS